jgi:dipeptidyl aminopeptidase/acylaminoacyl peptidase
MRSAGDDDDPDVQFNQTVMLKDAERRRKVDVEEMVLPDEGHKFAIGTVEFLRRKLR